MKAVALVALLCVAGAVAQAAAEVGRPASEATLDAFFHEFADFDHDGFLSPKDFAAFIYRMDPDETAMPTTDRVATVFAMFDLNGDGRVDYAEFRQFTRALNHHNADPATPVQVHLALSEDPTQMIVMWMANTTGTPTVQYGTQPGSFPSSATGTAKRYTVPLYESLPIATVVLKGLSPRTRYYYRCGDGKSWSVALNFTSSPNGGATPSKVSWSVFGDMGTMIPLGYQVTNEMIAEHQRAPFDVILHVGDLAYAGVSSGGEWEPTWDAWMEQIEPLASIIPYQVTVGNHEHYYNYSAYINRFDMPGDSEGGNGNFWWSFDYGNVHVTSISTEHDYTPGSDQYKWADADMSAARSNPNTVWLVVAGHRPFYSSDKSEYNSHEPGSPMLKALEPLFVQYKVDLTVTGHMHCYERTYPTINGQVFATPGQKVYTKPTAPIHIVQGTAGAFIEETWVTPQPAWSASRQLKYGYGRMTVLTAPGNNTLVFEYKTGNEGSVQDSLTIYK